MQYPRDEQSSVFRAPGAEMGVDLSMCHNVADKNIATNRCLELAFPSYQV